MVAAITELTRGRHVSLVKRRLNQFLGQEDLDETTDRYQTLMNRLDQAVGAPDAAEAGSMTFNQLKTLLRMSLPAAQQWLQWAITGGLVLRGVEANCDRCGHKQWRPLAEIVPTLVCHGCGEPIVNAHGFNHIEYRYRASESLLRAMSHDVLPSVLAIRYIASVMGVRDGMVFGAYPGIELRRDAASKVEAEVDVLAVLRTGGVIIGECKTNARGLTSEELNSLWKAADQIGARATFGATLDRAQVCGPLWKTRTAPNGRPHFALTAEHLFDLQMQGPTVNEEIFDWRDDPAAPRGASEPAGWAAVDEAFSRHTEGSATDYLQLRRAPWMSTKFIDPMRMPPGSGVTCPPARREREPPIDRPTRSQARRAGTCRHSCSGRCALAALTESGTDSPRPGGDPNDGLRPAGWSAVAVGGTQPTRPVTRRVSITAADGQRQHPMTIRRQHGRRACSSFHGNGVGVPGCGHARSTVTSRAGRSSVGSRHRSRVVCGAFAPSVAQPHLDQFGVDVGVGGAGVQEVAVVGVARPGELGGHGSPVQPRWIREATGPSDRDVNKQQNLTFMSNWTLGGHFT